MTQKILLEEFKFYNKDLKLFEENILDELREKTKVQDVYWTNEELSKEQIGLKFSKDSENNTMIELISFSPAITVKQVCDAKEIILGVIFNFKPNLVQEEVIREILQDRYDNFNSLDLYNSFDEFKIHAKKQIEHYIQRSFGSFLSLSETAKEVLGIDFNNLNIKISRPYNSHTDLYLIVDVAEKEIAGKNTRLAVIGRIENCRERQYNKWYDSEEDKKRKDEYNDKIASTCQSYFIQMFPDDSQEFLYIDKTAIFLKLDQGNRYYFDLSLNTRDEEGNLQIFCRDYSSILRNLKSMLGDSKIITKKIIDFYVKEEQRLRSDVNRNGVQSIILQKYQRAIADGKTVSFNHLLISKQFLKTDDNQFSIEFDEKFIEMEDCFYEIRNLITSEEAMYNFNTIYEKILNLSVLQKYEQTGKILKENALFKVNGMQMEISKGIKDGRVKINNVYCRISDVTEILSKAICYNNVEDFNKYVHEVSYIGLTYKKMISTGIHINLKNPLTYEYVKLINKSKSKPQTDILLRFSLLWDTEDRKKVYLYINEKKYLIKNKQKFKSFFYLPSKYCTIYDLKRELKQCLAEFADDEIITIVQSATEEAKIVKQRGIQFLNETAKDICAEKGTIEVYGKNVNGYHIIGCVTGSKFFVAEEGDLSVYKYSNGKWGRRCVVDDPNKNRIFEDRLANRLANIYNENKNIQQIQG